MHIRKRNPRTKKWILLTIFGFHLQFADSTYSLQIPHTIAGYATIQFNYTHIFICLWIPQTQTLLDFANTVADSPISPILEQP